MRHLFTFIAALSLALGLTASAATDPAALGIKAQRYFDQKEWASAAAIYSLLIDLHPDSAGLYGRAITVAGLRHIPAEQKSLLQLALKHRVPIDSVFSAVQSTSFSLGRADLLEDFLILSAESEPWLARKIDAALLGYFTFRRDGSAMVRYADKMLAGLPDNEFYRLRRAEGLLMMGRRAEAREGFAAVAEANPRCLTALLFLGEMARDDGDTASALAFLTRANEIAPTPALAAAIGSLTAPAGGKRGSKR